MSRSSPANRQDLKLGAQNSPRNSRRIDFCGVWKHGGSWPIAVNPFEVTTRTWISSIGKSALTKFSAALSKRFLTMIVLEHVTTADAAGICQTGPNNLAATITLITCCSTGTTCWPVEFAPLLLPAHSKRATPPKRRCRPPTISGSPNSFWAQIQRLTPKSKGSCLGCAGAFQPILRLNCTEVFEELGALDKLGLYPATSSPDFYGLPRNQDKDHTDQRRLGSTEYYPLGDQRRSL